MEYAHFTSFLLDGTNTNLSPFSEEMQSELFLISFLTKFVLTLNIP